VGVVSISIASTCVVEPLDMEAESIDRIEVAVLRRSMCRFTSILLLK
jgi:hypothetical protein